MTKTKHTCSKCKKEYNKIVEYKGRLLCRFCYKEEMTKNVLFNNSTNMKKILRESLEKKYFVKSEMIEKNGKLHIKSYIEVPPILSGKKLKLIEVIN